MLCSYCRNRFVINSDMFGNLPIAHTNTFGVQ